MQVFPQAIKKSRARIESKRVILAVNFQVNVYGIFHTGSCRLFGCICRRNANELRSQGHRRARDGELLEELAAALGAAEGLSRFITARLVATG